MRAHPQRFHHVGLRATEPQPNENFVTATRVWVTDPNADPYRIEYLRYEPDSYLDERFKNTPHIAWVVDDIDPWIAGKEIAIAAVRGRRPAFVRVAFVWEEGMISEYMAFKPGAVWFDPNDVGKEPGVTAVNFWKREIT